MLSAALFCLIATPAQTRYGVYVLEEGATKAVPFGRLRDQIRGITVTGNRAYLWTEQALWWTDTTGKRLVRVNGLPFTNRSGETLLTHRAGLEPGGGLVVWSSDGRLWRVYDKAIPVPGLPKGTEVYRFETGFRRTYLATNRGLWRLDSFHKDARPMPHGQDKSTGFSEFGEGAILSQGQKGLVLDKGQGAPPTPVSGPMGQAEVLSGSRWKNRALILSAEGFWSLAEGETEASFLPGSEKLGICFGHEFDGRRIWGWGGIEGTLRFYDLERKAFGVVPNFRNEITCVQARSKDVLVGTYFSGLFRVDKGTLAVRKISFSGGTVSDIVPFGKRMLIGTRQGMSH